MRVLKRHTSPKHLLSISISFEIQCRFSIRLNRFPEIFKPQRRRIKSYILRQTTSDVGLNLELIFYEIFS